jgi:tripartite-type tricarboxylate transporter receptor subunit TctC
MRSVWAFVVVFATMQPALAQDYPARNVSFIVATGAGAATDLLARILATRLGDRLGKAFVVENRPGAGTVLGADAVAKANPDGHTILMGTSTPLAINASLHKKLPYDPAKDFMPLALIATGRSCCWSTTIFRRVRCPNSSRWPSRSPANSPTVRPGQARRFTFMPSCSAA